MARQSLIERLQILQFGRGNVAHRRAYDEARELVLDQSSLLAVVYLASRFDRVRLIRASSAEVFALFESTLDARVLAILNQRLITPPVPEALHALRSPALAILMTIMSHQSSEDPPTVRAAQRMVMITVNRAREFTD
eukprot:GHVR01161747.1.p1 GENE.GHVR01161747.1~~GHVR01161747.1.p1  ORF type:complete len:137 (+),score=2.25 GHVR01161747.1:16-426(+)